MPSAQVLSAEQIDELLRQPNGTNIVLNLARDGLLDVHIAADALYRDRERMGRFVKRFIVAMTEALVAG